MGTKSTYTCSREFAIAAITKKLEDCSNRQLRILLDEAIHSLFYNFHVVDGEVDPKENEELEPIDLDDLPPYDEY